MKVKEISHEEFLRLSKEGKIRGACLSETFGNKKLILKNAVTGRLYVVEDKKGERK